MLYLIYIERLVKQPKKQTQKPSQQPKTQTKKPKKPTKKTKIIGSIEIDPEQIDKFYVKKSG